LPGFSLAKKLSRFIKNFSLLAVVDMNGSYPLLANFIVLFAAPT
jgi:hypothetical protein